jgi:hypothetical protein
VKKKKNKSFIYKHLSFVNPLTARAVTTNQRETPAKSGINQQLLERISNDGRASSPTAATVHQKLTLFKSLQSNFEKATKPNFLIFFPKQFFISFFI